MNIFEKAIGHTKTILQHKYEVGKLCVKCGLYGAAITHDLSKFSPTEYLQGVKYFTGTKSPHYLEREVTGVSHAWMHHRGRNKHHAEYWHDISLEKGVDVPVDMPARYIIEMLCDRISACKVYLKDKFTASSPLEYYESHKDENEFSDMTAYRLHTLLKLYAEIGEERFCSEVRSTKGDVALILKNRVQGVYDV